MHTHQFMEALIQHELKGLCTNCSMACDCTYRKATHKIIIQCQLYQLSDESENLHSTSVPKGLCVSCDLVDSCQLPVKHTGIWHCEEYV